MPETGSPTPRAATPPEHLPSLVRLLAGRPVVALTGAGVSTASGIPDYRGPVARMRVRAPMRYQEFVRDEGARARYWARSAVGWPRFRRARPNPAHRALADLDAAGSVRGIITQNVDGLHQEAGACRVLELHGSLGRVRCLECGGAWERDGVQERIEATNPDIATFAATLAPDGDVDLPEEAVQGFKVPACRRCGGVLKPDVVFFGENVPGPRVRRAWDLFREAEALLVAGTSLTVYSGRRFVLQAAKDGVPVGLVNVGRSRGDEFAQVRVEAPVEAVLPALASALLNARPGVG